MVAAALYFPQLPNGITIAVMLSSEEYWNACGKIEVETVVSIKRSIFTTHVYLLPK